MADIEDLVQKARDLAGKHPDQVRKAIQKLEELADKHLPEQYDPAIEHAGQAAEGFLGGTRAQGGRPRDDRAPADEVQADRAPAGQSQSGQAQADQQPR